MGIFNSVCETIKRYGSTVTILDKGGKSTKTKAFVEPLRYKNKIYIGGQYHLLGLSENEKYLYIGLPENTLTANSSVIETHGRKYIVKRRETYYVTDSPVYVWAILAPFSQALEDDYESD